jgi:YidC/Oxa1 family membrane protein insertase
MEKRVLLAIVLMVAVIVATNLLFPPSRAPQRQAGERDTVVDTVARTADGSARPDTASADDTAGAPSLADGGGPGGDAGDGAPQAGEDTAPEPAEADGLFGTEEETAAGDTVVVSSPLYTYRFTTLGAGLVGAELERYASYAPNGEGEKRAQLVRDGDAYLRWQVTDGSDTLDLSGRTFEASARELELEEGGGPDSLVLRYDVPGRPGLAFRVTYRFRPDSYLVDVEGAFEGLGGRGYTVLTTLGRGLRTNEAEPDEDYDQLAYAVNQGGGDIQTHKLDDVESGEERAAEGGPFRWVAVKNKYFLAALVAPEDVSGFGGLMARGLEEEHAAEMRAALPVPAGDPGFSLQAYFGPQEYDRLRAVGHDLQNVNPIGYDWMQFLIRPLANIAIAILTWMHTTLNLAYGWVLILFGVMVRVVLFPLYQKSMRAQMDQMRVQPKLKEIQNKYEDDPEKLQQEMMRLYKEHDINPLAGCLPMLLPFPILITLFFVFRSTIEFRGVPFLWIPDLSLQDPLYITPVAMAGAMFLMQWIGQRGMERNTQMKLMSYGMPVIMLVIFWRFPAGLNLYYATSNMASIPQQWYLAKERRKAQEKGQMPSGDD